MKHVGFLLNLIALGLFIPGILLPMFSLNMDMSAQTSGAQLTSEVINKQLSLIATIEELWQDERLLVASLIFLFSIAIPVIKTALIASVYFMKNAQIATRIASIVSVIGKWSMADVFVVAIFLAVLSTNHSETANAQQLSMFGFKMDIVLSSATQSGVMAGFYYFAGYCLVSLLGSQVSQFALKKHQQV